MQDREVRQSELVSWIGEDGLGNHSVIQRHTCGLLDAVVTLPSGREIAFSYTEDCEFISSDETVMLSEIRPDLFWEDEIEEETSPLLENSTQEQGETNDVFAQLQDDTFGDYTEDRRFYAAELSGWWGV
jgi:hypothetical protein